jgi:hypothetical protein
MIDRIRRRAALLTGGVLAAAVVVVAPPTTALAGTYCDNEPALGNYHAIDPQTGWLDIFWINSSAQTFNTADSRIVSNNLGSAVTGTAMSQVSQTFTLSSTTSVTQTVVKDFLSQTVSNTITASRTTQLGVSTTFTVPAYGAVEAGYGVVAYNVNYHVDLFELSQGHCWWKGSQYSVPVNAPTNLEGWQLTELPTINSGGVVNGSDYSAGDIHPNTTVAVFGQGFAPSDRVLVYDGGVQYTIAAGSPYWYDSTGQINATLPNLPSGSATLSVVASTGRQSNSIPITINP